MRCLLALLVLVAAACSKTPSDADPRPASKAGDVEQGASKPPMTASADAHGFDDAVVGSMPARWRSLETNGIGTPARWGIATDADAPSAPNVFAVLETKNTGQTYNVALLDGPPLQDPEVQVAVKAGSGEEDRGGGLVFRAQGATDYYIARWNPIEHNAKIYKVVGQFRTALGVAETSLEVGDWHTLRVRLDGPTIELFIDDASVLQVSDSALPDAGSVGLWTKADAATLFDDFSISGS